MRFSCSPHGQRLSASPGLRLTLCDISDPYISSLLAKDKKCPEPLRFPQQPALLRGKPRSPGSDGHLRSIYCLESQPTCLRKAIGGVQSRQLILDRCGANIAVHKIAFSLYSRIRLSNDALRNDEWHDFGLTMLRT